MGLTAGTRRRLEVVTIARVVDAATQAFEAILVLVAGRLGPAPVGRVGRPDRVAETAPVRRLRPEVVHGTLKVAPAIRLEARPVERPATGETCHRRPLVGATPQETHRIVKATTGTVEETGVTSLLPDYQAFLELAGLRRQY